MFSIGDLVEIKLPDYPVYKHSAVDNLVGTIAKIEKVHMRTRYMNPYAVYTLKFVELHLKEPDLFEESYSHYEWRDQHLKAVMDYDPELKFKDIDISEMFT